MIEQFGGTLNFIAVLIPCLMGLFYGYRCLVATDAFIEQYGLGAASEFIRKTPGCCVGAQGIVYAILIITSPVGAWAVFAYGTIHAALFLIFGWMTVNGKWAEVEGVKGLRRGVHSTCYPTRFSSHNYVQYDYYNLWSCSRSKFIQVGLCAQPKLK